VRRGSLLEEVERRSSLETYFLKVLQFPCHVAEMASLFQETEALAKRLADAQNTSIAAAIRGAPEERARAAGVIEDSPRGRRRMSVPEILAVGDEIAVMPLSDQRSPREILDDVNEPRSSSTARP
jgi:hypothetical protein